MFCAAVRERGVMRECGQRAGPPPSPCGRASIFSSSSGAGSVGQKPLCVRAQPLIRSDMQARLAKADPHLTLTEYCDRLAGMTCVSVHP
jgi:hypothetical protein